MRKLELAGWITKTASLGVLALALAAPASAGTVFGWTTEEGIEAYTNDPKRIPERYKESARKTVMRDGLESYARYTPRDSASDVTYADRLYARVAHLRALNGYLDAKTRADRTTPPGHETVLRLSRGVSVNVPSNAGRGQEPLVVDRHRVRAPNRSVTRHVTVVRQGDRVVSVVRPMSSSNPLKHIDESELYE